MYILLTQRENCVYSYWLAKSLNHNSKYNYRNMAIHELSFRSVNSIPALSFYNHRIALNQAITPEQLEKHLSELAKRLSRETGMPVLAETTEVSLLSPYHLTSNSSFQILSVLAVEITAPRYRRQLQQLLNQRMCDFFRGQRLRVDAYKHEAFLEKVQISEEIEAQRFVRWNLRIDGNNYVLLAIDYSNAYQSLFTLEQRDLSSLSPDQPLVHIYDTVSEPLRELGNISLLEFHRRKGEVSEQFLSAIPLETPAVFVKYGSVRNAFIGSHIPHLLKKTFTKDDIESRVFNAQVLSIDERFKRAIKGIGNINKFGGLNIPGVNITFRNQPYSPNNQINYINVGSDKIANKYQKNLDFEAKTFGSYPSQGLAKRKLLEKPTRPVKVVVLHPNNLNVTNWCNTFSNFLTNFNIRLELIEFRSYPVANTLEIQRRCRDVDNYHLALMFVPDKDTFIYTPKSDPYPVLRREFIKAMLPSQAIEVSTLRSGFDIPKGYNLLLKILRKLGYCPWKLKNMPGEAQAFLGLDVGRKYDVAVGVAAFIVSPEERVIGWFPANFQAHRETFDISVLRQIIFDLVNLYEERNQTKLKHLVIHRDGTFQADELDLLDELMPELIQAGIEKLDAVEIIKSGYTRAGEWNENLQKWENPRRGWAWTISDTEVALMTTGKTEIKGGTNFVPRPIIVRRRRGDIKPGILAAQVYWLSEMHVGSTQTIRLPITT